MLREANKNRVFITMFGTLGVRSGGRSGGPADLGGVKPRDILEILLLHHGRSVTKDALADQIWPDKTPKNVLATLESYVSVLRKNLSKLSPEAGKMVVTGTGAYFIDNQLVTVDLDEFDDLRRRAADDPSDRIELRSRAMELAVADLLLDAGDARWVLAERELYRERVTRCGVLLSRDLLAVGDATGSIAAAEQAIHFNPFAEEAYRLAMVANYSLGLAGVARNVHEMCRSVVEDRLDRDLTSATDDLAGAIDAGVPVEELLEEIVGEAAGQVTARRRSVERRVQERQMPFVGRSGELDQALAAIGRAQESRSALVIVRGAVGSGRSALLDEIVRHRPSPIGRKRFVEAGRHHPEVPLAQPLLAALASSPGAGAAEDYRSLSWLGYDESYLLPLMRLIEQHGPVTLLLDDLHWADAALVRCLELIFELAPWLPLTVVATVCCPPEPAHVDLSRLSQLAAFETIELGALDQESLGEVDADLVKWTGGVPSLLADAWRWGRAGFSGLSPSMRGRVLGAIRGFDDIDGQILMHAATLGDRFAVETLATRMDLAEERVRERCERFVERDFFNRERSDYGFKAPAVKQLLTDAAALTDEMNGEIETRRPWTRETVAADPALVVLPI